MTFLDIYVVEYAMRTIPEPPAPLGAVGDPPPPPPDPLFALAGNPGVPGLGLYEPGPAPA